MKIIQLNTVTNGCTGRIACGIKEIANKTGHDCIIAYGRGHDNRPDMKRISSNSDNYIHAALTRITDTAGLHSKRATKEFLNFLEEYNPDIIQIHNLHGYYINYQLLFEYFRTRPNLKIFWTLHDCWPFTGHCPYYTYVGCDKWINGCHHCQQRLHHPTSYIVDRSKKNYEDKKKAFCGLNNLRIITPSKWMMREVKKSFLKEYDVEYIPNGIDLSVFHPTDNCFRQKHGIGERILILGVANLWAKTKGLDFFIELSNRLSLEQYCIVVVGLSEKQLIKLPKAIIGIKKTENLDELVDIYSSADIFLNPTLEDNFPTTNIESLACGTPVITFDTGGSPEALSSKCGLVVNKNINDIVAACRKMGRKEDIVIKTCLEQASKYDERICYGQYFELYER